jgi:hypothetical protein
MLAYISATECKKRILQELKDLRESILAAYYRPNGSMAVKTAIEAKASLHRTVVRSSTTAPYAGVL